MNPTSIPPLLLSPESEKVTIRCAHCGNAFEEIISRVMYEPKVCCPRCRHVVKVNLLQLHAMLEAARRQAGSLFKKLARKQLGRRSG